MKLLFDQNISFRIIGKLQDIMPFASQVRLLGLENSTDIEIWDFAKANDYTIITFDTSTTQLASYIRSNLELIKEFIQNADYKDLACLEIE